MESTLRAKIKDIDFESNTVTIHSGKGDKDRIVMLPKNIKPDLKEHISLCKNKYLNDLELGRGLVKLPDALSRKYPNASKEWRWQSIFLARAFCI